ncbi:hypothetical protein NIES4075_32260 [Tolypothrix sp. NIES-4075]|nr:hypothetical protein NIES4075_32260 [Tolypothrix sp. NIES-4075]
MGHGAEEAEGKGEGGMGEKFLSRYPCCLLRAPQCPMLNAPTNLYKVSMGNNFIIDKILPNSS